MKTARVCKRNNTYRRRRTLELQVGKTVFRKVTLRMGVMRFKMKGKFSPRYDAHIKNPRKGRQGHQQVSFTTEIVFGGSRYLTCLCARQVCLETHFLSQKRGPIKVRKDLRQEGSQILILKIRRKRRCKIRLYLS